MTISTQANTIPFPWEEWERLPKEEREAEMKESIKESQQAEDLRQQKINAVGDPDLLTGETADVDGSIGRSPFWDAYEIDIVTEGVGGHFFDTNQVEPVDTDAEVTGSIVNAFSPATSDPILNGAMADTADYGKHPVTGKKIEKVSINGGDVSLNGNVFRTSDYVKAAGIGTTLIGATVSAYSAASTPVTTIFGVKGTALGGAIAAGGLATTLAGQILGMAGYDEVEDDPTGTEFNSNPETLSPLNLDSALVTDAYQQQDAPGADLIASEANQGMDPYQSHRERYEVLA